MSVRPSIRLRVRLLATLGVGAILASAPAARAQDYPSRPIRMVVPWPAGGLVDIAARQVARRLQAALGQPVVVENRVGAGGSIGAEAVVRAAPDGYTLLLTSSALTIGSAIRVKQPFEVPKDFEPIALIANAPSVLVVGPAIAPATVAELVALARSKPGRLSYASAGVGSPAHMAGEVFKSRAGVHAVHIPYTGAPGAMTDQLGGRVDYQFANAAVALPQVRAGKVRALAVTGARRFAALPDVPTMVEAGVPDFDADQWLGLLGPRGLPPAVTARLAAEVGRALADGEMRAALVQAGMAPAEPGSPEAFAALLRRDLAKWAALVKAAGIEPE